MTDLIQRQKLFTQDDVAIRLSKIANNLGAIKREVTTNADAAVSLIRESLYFIEWTVPTLVDIDVEQAAELVDLGRNARTLAIQLEKNLYISRCLIRRCY